MHRKHLLPHQLLQISEGIGKLGKVCFFRRLAQIPLAYLRTALYLLPRHPDAAVPAMLMRRGKVERRRREPELESPCQKVVLREPLVVP